MAKPSKPSKPRLTPLQRAFVREFVGNPDPHIRCNGTRAYQLAQGKGLAEHVARAAASRMLTNVNVRHAIQVAQIQADAVLLAQLVDWKMEAIQNQPHLLALVQGRLPTGQSMTTRDDAAVGQVVLGALKEILDRGFPKALYLKIDPRESLARLLGVPVESLPERIEDPA